MILIETSGGLKETEPVQGPVVPLFRKRRPDIVITRPDFRNPEGNTDGNCTAIYGQVLFDDRLPGRIAGCLDGQGLGFLGIFRKSNTVHPVQNSATFMVNAGYNRSMDQMRADQIRKFLQSPVFGITEIDDDALIRYDRALTHGSFKPAGDTGKDFERLSFLGNYVLDFVIPDYVYRRFPEASRGEMKPFVERTQNRHLAKVSTTMPLNLDTVIWLGSGTLITDDIRADAFEALIAAIYLDKGIEKVRDAVIHLFKDEIGKLEGQDPESRKSWKNRLGEYVQKKWKTAPTYNDPKPVMKVNKNGIKVWYAQVKVNGELWGEGEGKRLDGIDGATDNAAKDAFEKHCMKESG